MPRCGFSHVTTTGTKACMDHISTIAKKTPRLAETRTSPSQMEKTISDILNDAKQIVVRLNAKTSSEPISQERMSGLQELHLSKEIIFDEVQLSKETGSLMNASSGNSSKEDATSISAVSTRSVSDGQKILSEIQEDVANIQESLEEDGDYFRDEPSRDEGYFMSLASLPSNLQPKKNVLENIRGAKNNIRKLLYQLYEAIELTCQNKQGSEGQQNYHKALFELWINWSKSLSKNVDDTQLVEALTLDMFRSISLKLQSAFMDLMPKVQGLPSSLQDKLQQACYDMQGLHITFSLCGAECSSHGKLEAKTAGWDGADSWLSRKNLEKPGGQDLVPREFRPRI